jgi:cation:H+ antiporter
MPVAAAIPLFVVSLAVTLAAARLFARRLDMLGRRFGFPEALVGLLTALAADGPEVSSALIALLNGAHSVSVGVLVGSNAFNLAAMIGASGLLVGSVLLPREALLLEGLTGLAITLIAAAVLLRWLAPAGAAALALGVVVPYLLVIRSPKALARIPRPPRPVQALERALEHRGRRQRVVATDPTHHLLGLIAADIALIVAGSAGMVQAALALGDEWHISRAVLGVLILAPLTSLPNAATAVQLGHARRGAALVGETFNSNTINLAAGVIAPALFVSLGALSGTDKLQLVWLIGMTMASLVLLGRRRGMRRPGAAALVALYAGFVAIVLASR